MPIEKKGETPLPGSSPEGRGLAASTSSSLKMVLSVMHSWASAGMLLDENRAIQEPNTALVRLLGYSPQALTGRPLEEITPGGASGLNRLKALLAAMEPFAEEEITLLAQGGQELDCLISSSPLRDAQDRFCGWACVLRDVTRWRRLQGRALRSEALFTRIFHTNPHPICIYSLAKKRYLDVNQALLDLTGYTRGEFLAEPPSSPQIVSRKERELLAQLWREQGRVRNLELLARCKDGRLIPILTSLEKIDLQGESCFLIISNDISIFKNAMAARDASEETFRKIFELSPLPITITQMQPRRFVDVNEAFCQVFGYSRQEVLGHSAEQLGMWGATENLERATRIRRAKGRMVNEPFTLRAKDGRRVDTLASAETIEAGGELNIIYVLNDITELKKGLDAVVRSQTLFSKLFYESPFPMCLIDAGSGATLDINRAYTRTFGYAKEEVLAQADMGRVLWQDQGERERLEHKITQLRRLTNEEAHLCTKGGQALVGLLSAEAIDMEGVLAYVYIFNDITQRKRAQEEKDRLEAQLIQAQKQEAIGTLAGGVAHDFNNLLTGIIGNVSLMLANLKPGDENHDRLTAIQHYAQSGARLTKQLLGFARGGWGVFEPLDIGEIIAKSLGMFARTHKNIRVSTRLSPRLKTVAADRAQLEQVFINLFINAAQAMAGGGRLSVRATNTRLPENHPLRQTTRTAKKFIRIEVRDTGLGMNPATIGRVFEPFFTTKEKGRGTGMGLASVYGIIKRHGGSIEAASPGRRGAVFTILLPASDQKPTRQAKRLAAPATTGNETVLLVDDERVVLNVGLEILGSLGYRVLAANSGREALEVFKARQGEIDLVILDLVMPGLDGWEVLKKLRALSPQLRVLIVSGYGGEGDLEEMLRLNQVNFLQKPYDLASLATQVRASLDG